MRRLVAIAAVALLACAEPALAAPVELQGTMTVSTSTAGSVLVHIASQTATFPDANGKGALETKFSGPADVRALVLLAETPGPDGKRFAGYVDGSGYVDGNATWTGQQIPAGDYRLYAVADGKQATVAITMPTGTGSSALALPDPATYDVHLMQAGGSGGVFRASAATTGPGVFFSYAEATFGSGQAGTVELCEAVGESADTDDPYSFGCSQGDVFPMFGGSDFGTIASSTVFDSASAARHGFGGNAQALTPPAVKGAVGGLTFTPPGAPSQSPIAPARGTAARVVSTKVRVSKAGRAPVKVRCAGPGTCHARLAISGSSAKGKATIPAGATKKVNVRLTSSMRKRLKRSRSIKVTLVLQVTGDSGTGTTVTRRRVTLTAPRR